MDEPNHLVLRFDWQPWIQFNQFFTERSFKNNLAIRSPSQQAVWSKILSVVGIYRSPPELLLEETSRILVGWAELFPFPVY